MIIYHYTQTGEYLGEGLSDACPITGEALIPAFATELQPLPNQEGKKVVFLLGEWKYEDIPVVPPPNPPTKAQQILKLNAEYTAQREKLKADLTYVNAYYPGDVTRYTQAKTRLDALNAEYNTKLGVIMNG